MRRKVAGGRRAARFSLFGSLAVILFIPLLAPRPAAAEVKVIASLDPDGVEVGDQAVLSVEIDGTTSVDQGPSVPQVQGLDIRPAGQSTNISIVNGRMTRSVTFQFLLFGRTPGQYTIGPIEVRDGKTIYRSNEVTLTVGAAQAPQGGAGQMPPGGGPGQASSGRSQAGEGEGEGGDLFVRSEIDRDHVFVGEQVTLRFQFFQRAGYPLLQAPQYNPPTTEGFWREDLPPQRTSTRTIRGAPYQVTDLVYALFPTQSGRLEIGPGELQCVVRGQSRSRDPFDIFGNFFTEREVDLHSRPLTVRVDPLPEPRPADFTGGVGSFRLNAALERTEVPQNSPVTLSITVEGKGNVSTVGDPKLPDLAGIRSYPSGSDVKSDKSGDVLGGKKTFQIVLIPESTGRKTIPPIRISVFDPQSRVYVHLETQPLEFQVGAALASASDAAGGEVTRVGRDLRTIRSSTRLRPGDSFRVWRGSGFWFTQLVPLMLVALAWGWRARRRRMEADWGLTLSRGASGRLRRELEALRARTDLDPAAAYARLDHALERFLTDRFRLPVRGRTREELLDHLGREQVSEEALAEIRAVLDRCDFARFAPGAQTIEEFRTTLDQASRLPALLGRKNASPAASVSTGAALLALLIGSGLAGGFLHVSRSARADILPAARADMVPAAPLLNASQAAALFQEGNQAYQKGDYADAVHRYERILAAGFESPDLLLNLGDASYRAGRLGWAVYYFERGRRLAPADPDLKANLDLALQETKDRVPDADASRFLNWLVRMQDRTSMSRSLRWLALFWWLFLVWLAVRLAWNAAEVPEGGAGWPLRRRALTVAGLVLGGLLLASGGWTTVKALQMAGAPGAVVVADELPVRSNPDPEATVEFSLHAGTRVRLGREMRGFREVLFSDKLRGWGGRDGLADLSASGPAAVSPADLEPGSFSAR